MRNMYILMYTFAVINILVADVQISTLKEIVGDHFILFWSYLEHFLKF
jgi:hypothetical protein